jgi:hypothetical protein|tara:strand:+ start:3786 stop:4004 length:219 start_codon:yes stop_codon:yes gene_type:complete
MTIRELVSRLEKIESKANGNTRDALGLLIEDIIEFDMNMSKVFGKLTKDFEDEDFMSMLFDEGIKNGQIGEA